MMRKRRSGTGERTYAIGGYFELGPGRQGRELYPAAKAFQSGRAAFLALLSSGRPARIWLPWYLCEEMVSPVERAGIEVVRYAIDEALGVGADAAPRRGDWLLCVNYFGLCDAQVDAALARFDPMQVIVDNSHALFSAPRTCRGTIYSPRKFVGVPDGGYLVTGDPVPLPEEEDQQSAERCKPLAVRAADSAEAGYAEYRRVEAAFSGQAPLRMSALTRTMLAAVDYAVVARRRRDNHARLARLVGHENALGLQMDTAAVPLAYPFLAGDAGLRAELLARRIYAPRYWPHLADAASGAPAWERHLASLCLPLPCDQRYAAHDMAEVAEVVLGAAATVKRRKNGSH